MKYLLNDDILKLKFSNSVNPNEAMLFYRWHGIQTISDLLKHGEEVRRNRNLQLIVENIRRNNIKFDDELSAEELKKRNEERERLEMESKKIRAKHTLEELLSRKIESLNLPKEVINQLRQHQIYTIEDLIDGSSYMFFQKDSTIFKEKHVIKIIDALANIGLYLNMINPISHEIDKKDEFKSEEETVEKIKAEESTPEVIQEEQKPLIVHEIKQPEIIPVKPRKKQSNINAWDRHFEYLKIFKSYFGHIFIPRPFKHDGLGEWIINQRKAYRGTKGKITKDQIQKLELLGISWIGIGNDKELKQKYYKSLNIKDVKVVNGILFTYYLDDTVKSTNDKEFIDMLEGKIELPKEILDMMDRKESTSESESYGNDEIRNLMERVFEELPEETEDDVLETVHENAEESLDAYSLMRKRIEDMKSKREIMLSENDKKKHLIEEYKGLIRELETLTAQGLELDNTINNLLGIEGTHKIEETEANQEQVTIDNIENARQSLSEKISKKKEDNLRKQELIDEFRNAEAQLIIVQNESDELDSQIASMLNPNNSHIKKRGEL